MWLPFLQTDVNASLLFTNSHTSSIGMYIHMYACVICIASAPLSVSNCSGIFVPVHFVLAALQPATRSITCIHTHILTYYLWMYIKASTFILTGLFFRCLAVQSILHFISWIYAFHHFSSALNSFPLFAHLRYIHLYVCMTSTQGVRVRAHLWSIR